jgi:hypothetical protein
MFSALDVFHAKLMRILYESLSIPASASADAGSEVLGAKISETVCLAEGIARSGRRDWAWSVARAVDSGDPNPWALRLLAAFNKVRNELFIELDVGEFAKRFGPEEPFAVVPIGRIFAGIYRRCKKLHGEID